MVKRAKRFSIKCFNCGKRTFDVHVQMINKSYLCKTCVEVCMLTILKDKHDKNFDIRDYAQTVENN